MGIFGFSTVACGIDGSHGEVIFAPSRSGLRHVRRSFILLPLVFLACGTAPSEEQVLVPKRLSILVQPLGEVDPLHVDSLANAIRVVHDAEVHVAAARRLPAHVFTTIRSARYRADTLIAWLRSVKPDSIDLIVGLTSADISITKRNADGTIKDPEWKYRDFGIFGLGFLGGPSCVVSTYRYQDHPRFFERLWKISVHEVGHCRSLPHCANTTCVMRDAVESMSTIDDAQRTFCEACMARLTPSRSPSARSRSVSAGS